MTKVFWPTFTLVFSKVCVLCPVWLFSVVPWFVFSWYVAQVFSESFWGRSNCPNYWCHICFYIPHALYFCSSIYFFWRYSPKRARASSFLRFLDHTHWHTTVGRTPLDEWSARRRDLYLTIHNTHTIHKYPCPRRDSNPQEIGLRPSP